MSEETKTQSGLDPELDALLDDALEDFSKPLPTVAPIVPPAQPKVSAGEAGGSNLLTEDVIKNATKNFEASMRAIMAQQQQVASSAASLQAHTSGSGGGADPLAGTAQLDVNALTAEFSKFADTASKVAAAASGGPSAASTSDQEMPDFQKLMTEAMQQMAQNNQAYQNAPSQDELGQLLAGLGLGSGADGAAAAGLVPLMQSMLENILTKDVLYPPMKEIVDKYPDWLADNRASLETAEFDRYSRQFDAMKKVVDLFESETESDSDEVKAARFENLLVLMQKLQAEGHPPSELAGDMSGVMPDLANFDPANPGSVVPPMPDFSAMLGSLATAPVPLPGTDPQQPNIGEEQCCIM